MGKDNLRKAICLAVQGKKRSDRFGRTRLMKTLYFLQEVAGSKLGLDFEIYTWGPYAKEVLQVKDSLKEKGILEEIAPDSDLAGHSFSICLTKDAPKIQASSRETDVFNKLKAKSASELEALSTLHFVHDELKASKEDVVQTVKNLKPYFKIQDLNRYYDNLDKWGWLK